MAKYNCFLKEVTVNEGVAEGGTALEAIGKETVEPTAPSEVKFIKQNGTPQKIEGTFIVPTLAEGEKVIAATLHVYLKVAAEGKAEKIQTVLPLETGEPTVKVASSWVTVALSKAHAEELTQAKLNELHFRLERILAKLVSIYEVYLSLETSTATVFVAKPTIAFTLADTMQATETLAAKFTSQMVLADTVVAAQKLAAALDEKLVMADSVAAIQTTAAKLVDKLEMKDTLVASFKEGAVTLQASPTVKLTFQDAFEARQLLEASPSSKVVLGFGLTAASAAAIAMTDRNSLKMTAKAVFKAEGGVSRVSVYIFEE